MKTQKIRFQKSTGKVNVDNLVLKRWDGLKSFHYSDNWVSNGIWAIKKSYVNNIAELTVKAMKEKGFGVREHADMEFFNFVNYRKEPFLKTREVLDMRDTRHKYRLRVFKRESDGLRVLFNDVYTEKLKIHGILMGESEKAFTDLDCRVIIMPFSEDSYPSFVKWPMN